MNISKTKVMRCARDGVPKEAAMDPCSVCGKRVGVNLGDMLNDAGGVEQAVATRGRAAWMMFRELGGILCMRGASLRMKGIVYKACVCSVLTYGAETWAMKAGVFQMLRATERRMLRMICRVMLKDMVESTVIASRVGVDDLEEHLR